MVLMWSEHRLSQWGFEQFANSICQVLTICPHQDFKKQNNFLEKAKKEDNLPIYKTEMLQWLFLISNGHWFVQINT